ncbi:hypothetical protein ILYODFUR_034125 [Ilyodon furcidens]|uniref:Uncharacterized protein n=1 Tax=Ilyodon furcidens TaxID=33524 RepID=A0ABV0TFX2_9TELE
MGASNPSLEGPSSMVSSQLFSPESVDSHPAPSAVLQPSVQPPAQNWLQARLEKIKKGFMKKRCCGYVLHLMDHPEDLDLVHSVLQAEFIKEGWLDAPAPVSAGGPFLVAIRAAQIPKDPGPLPGIAKLYEPLQPQVPEFPGGSENGSPLLPEFPEGSENGSPLLPEFPEGFEDELPLILAPGSDTPEPDSGPDTPQLDTPKPDARSKPLRALPRPKSSLQTSEAPVSTSQTA